MAVWGTPKKREFIIFIHYLKCLFIDLAIIWNVFILILQMVVFCVAA